jgi:hypothetical protein
MVLSSNDPRHASITNTIKAGMNELVNREWHGHAIRDAHGGFTLLIGTTFRRQVTCFSGTRERRKKKWGWEKIHPKTLPEVLPERFFWMGLTL